MSRSGVRAVFRLFLALSIPGSIVAIAPPASALAITVTTTTDEFSDPGPGDGCALREAIRAANGNSTYGGCTTGASGEDTISLSAGTYELTIGKPSATEEDAAATGDLDLVEDVVIQGPIAGEAVIDGSGFDDASFATPQDRVFHVLAGTVATIRRVTITGGDANGGAQDLTGGGIWNAGSLTLENVAVTGNGDVGIRNADPGAGTASLTLSDSSVSANGGAVGAGILNGVMVTGGMEGSTLVLERSTISRNVSPHQGGGLYNGETATATVTASTISGNEAVFDGGGVYNGGTLTLNSATVADNSATHLSNPEGAGGGIESVGGTVTLRNTILASNVHQG
ncbi:MAG: CSLREA domain-containing protein, partial [Actinomycetota bacterium]